MSLSIEGPDSTVVSLEAYRNSTRHAHPTGRSRADARNSSSYHRIDTSPLLEDVQTRAPLGIGMWHELIAESEGPDFERMSRDWSTSPGPYELDMPRYRRAQARFTEDYDEFLGWKEMISKLFLMHCAHRCGEPIAANDLDAVYQAYVRGGLHPSESHFNPDIQSSPYETLLVQSFHELQEGLTSANSVIARESIELASDMFYVLSDAKDLDVSEEAETIRDAAVSFLRRSTASEDSARVARSLNRLTLRFPGLRNDAVIAEMYNALGVYKLGIATGLGYSLTHGASLMIPSR